jgi:predicted NUDIX family NTP pyrophosphohydrolase
MSKQSAGILLYRTVNGKLEVLLVHPGGPFFTRKDAGIWSVPKGEFELGEDLMATAKREFQEEIGSPAPAGDYIDLGSVKNKSGKTIYVFATKGDLDARAIKSNLFDLEWPPRSGAIQQFLEVDRAGWFRVDKALIKINSAQAELIERLSEKLDIPMPEPPPVQSSLF